jgi:hypothetical protein
MKINIVAPSFILLLPIASPRLQLVEDGSLINFAIRIDWRGGFELLQYDPAHLPRAGFRQPPKNGLTATALAANIFA